MKREQTARLVSAAAKLWREAKAHSGSRPSAIPALIARTRSALKKAKRTPRMLGTTEHEMERLLRAAHLDIARGMWRKAQGCDNLIDIARELYAMDRTLRLAGCTRSALRITERKRRRLYVQCARNLWRLIVDRYQHYGPDVHDSIQSLLRILGKVGRTPQAIGVSQRRIREVYRTSAQAIWDDCVSADINDWRHVGVDIALRMFSKHARLARLPEESFGATPDAISQLRKKHALAAARLNWERVSQDGRLDFTDGRFSFDVFLEEAGETREAISIVSLEPLREACESHAEEVWSRLGTLDTTWIVFRLKEIDLCLEVMGVSRRKIGWTRKSLTEKILPALRRAYAEVLAARRRTYWIIRKDEALTVLLTMIGKTREDLR